MAARSKYADPDTTADTAPQLDPAAAYLAALHARAAARRLPDGGEECGREEVEDTLPNGEVVIYTRLTKSPADQAAAQVHTARQALEAVSGRTAVALGNARFALSEAERELGETKTTHPGAGNVLAIMLATRTGLAELVERLTATAAAEQELIDRREGSAGAHAELLATTNRDLAAARDGLTDAARNAQDAMSTLLRQTAAYRKATSRARAQLVAAGFDGATKPNGDPYSTSVGSELIVDGTGWPEPDEVAVLLRVVHRVTASTGERGRIAAEQVRRLSYGAARLVDHLLAAMPAPKVDVRQSPAMPSMPALRDWCWDIPEPAAPTKGGYLPPDKPRPRRLGAPFTRTAR